MNCNLVQLRLNEIVDGEKSQAEWNQALLHIEHCSDCHHKYQQLKQIKLFMKSMKVPTMSNQFNSGLQAKIKSNKNLKHYIVPTSIAACLTLFISTWYLMDKGSLPQKFLLVEEMLDLGKPIISENEFIEATMNKEEPTINQCGDITLAGICT